jgi:transketolase
VIVGDFAAPDLTEAQLSTFARLAKETRGDILKMTTLAASGHPGGSISSVDFELVLWGCGRFDPSEPFRPDRDRVVVSHGHTSPAAYAILARLGWFDVSLPLLGFRRAGSPFEGHVERDVPGIEWGTGNLGQGLSVAAGFALAALLRGDGSRIFCTMGDGEQQKGQISEARRFAAREGLTNLVALLDWNRVQLSGDNLTIMPQDILADWRADGWEVLEVDGHDHRAVFHAVRAALASPRPALIACHTVMSKGIPFMEAGGYKWHGAPLTVDKCKEALAILGLPDDLDGWVAERKKPAPDWKAVLPHRPDEAVLLPNAGTPRTYAPDKATDNRSAFGTALTDLGDAAAGKVPMVVVDCDLSVSTKTDLFLAKHPGSFHQCGIAEHHAAVFTGALSLSGVSAWWGEFAMFGVAESYNQQRLNDINGTNVKLCVTHAGIDVGEDGKTHHSIDYFGLLNSTFGWRVYTPADPNQTDRIVRWMAGTRGNQALVMGRSKCPVITREDGSPFFAGDYHFDPRRADEVRTGEKLSIVAAGNMLGNALEAWKQLEAEGTRVDLFAVTAWSDLGEGSLVNMARHGRIVSVEDHTPRTGLGTLLQARMNDLGLVVRIRKLGVTGYASSGPSKELYQRAGLDPKAIARAVREELLRRPPGGWIPAVGSAETF